MKDVKIEVTDEGTGMYVAADPAGKFARSTSLGDLVSVDWDAQGNVIGVELLGSAARRVADALEQALEQVAPGVDLMKG